MIRDIFTYRGKEGYWLWVLHRATGVGIFLFLAIHIVDTLLVFWPSLYDAVTGLYRHPLFRVGEILLVGMVLFHAVNGLRILVLDLWEASTKHRRELFYATLALLAVLLIPALLLMVREIIL